MGKVSIFSFRFVQRVEILLVLVASMAISLGMPSAAVAQAQQASPEREFIMSCTYGVLAGTLVGAASLAFVDKPGDNLKLVARGASIGLYMGIGLGIYTVYILPKQLEREEDRIIEGQTGSLPPTPRWLVYPTLADQGDVGVGFNFYF